MNSHIVFANNDDWNNRTQTKKNQNFIYLLKNRSSLMDNIKCIPKTFTITTRNGSTKFNIDMLKDTSTIIYDFNASNPHVYQYDLDIEDKENNLEKFEKIYQGELVSFGAKEIKKINQIIDLLNIQNIPKPRENLNNPNEIFGFTIVFKYFKKYLKRTAPRSFIISTNKKDYQCNNFGVLSSKVISQFLMQNPTNDRFIFDFPDECNEFQSICDIFNFQKVKITVNNMDSLNEIAKILQITDILNDIESFINEHNTILQIIDSQKENIDSIEQLCDFLYHISDKTTTEDVQNIIIKSKWSKTEENVQEMAAFILQVIKTDFSLHQNLIDLLNQLNEKANETNKLGILVPFIADKLLSVFGESQSICSFIYKLFKNGFITKEKISIHLKNIFQDKNQNNKHKAIFSLNWFLPEVIEIGVLDENEMVSLCDEKQLAFLLSYLPDDLEKYKIMRDLGEPDNELTKAIRNDDVDSLKSMIIKNYIDISKVHISYNIFEDFVQNGKTNFIDYAAAYGSLKCFKYLFLNHEIIDPITFEYSVFGSNLEIIKIANQNAVEAASPQYKRKVKSMFDVNYRNNMFDLIIPAVKKHQNDLFDWILEQKYTSKGIIGYLLHSLVISSVRNGNVHSLIEIIDKGYHFINEQKISMYSMYSKYTYQEVIETAARNGFKSIMKILLSLFKRFNLSITNPQNFISFGNKSIMKKAIKFMKSKDIESLFICAIKLNDLSLTEWIIDKYYFNNSFNLSQQFYVNALTCSIEMWNLFLVKKIPINFANFKQIKGELASANFDVFKIIMNNVPLETKENIFNDTLYQAITRNNKNLVSFLFSQNVEFENDEDSLFLAVNTKDIEMVDIVLKYNSQPSFINMISRNGTALYNAVKTNNVSIVKRLLSVPGIKPSLYSSNKETPLILAAKQFNIEIINLFLDLLGEKIKQNEINELIKVLINVRAFNNTSSIISVLTRISTIKSIDPNVIYDRTSFLLFACENNSIELVNNLLKFEDIDTNIYLPENGNTPLIISIQKKNVDIAKLILKHPGTDLNIKNFDRYDALYFAVSNNLYDIIDEIIMNESYKPKVKEISSIFYYSSKELLPHIIKSKYVDVNVVFSKKNTKNSKTKYGYSSMNNETKLVDAVRLYGYESVDAIVHHPSFDQERSNLSKALFKAYIQKDAKICKLLIDVAKTIKNYDEYGKSLFNIAYNNADLMTKLLKYPTFNSKEIDFLSEFNIIFNNHSDEKISVDVINVLYEYDIKHEHLIDLNKLLPYGQSYFTVIPTNVQNINEVFKFLLDHGADPNIVDLNEICPFEYAFSLSNNELINMLIDTNKINFSKNIKLTRGIFFKTNKNLFDLALETYNEDIVIKVLNNPSFDAKSVDLSNSFNGIFESSMHIFKTASITIMNILYEYDKEHEHSINFNKLLPNGKSYFTEIPTNLINIIETFKFFLDREVDLNIVDSNGITPFEHAISSKNTELISILIDTNKIDYTKDVLPITKYGNKMSNKFLFKLKKNLLEYALEKLSEDMIIKIIKSPTFNPIEINILFIFMRNLNSKAEDKRIPIHIMNMLYEFYKDSGNLIALNQLLPNGKSCFTAIPRDRTNMTDTVKFLLDHGADPNIIDSHGVCPFQYAMSFDSTIFAELLIDTNKIDFSIPIKNKKVVRFHIENQENKLNLFNYILSVCMKKDIIIKVLNNPSFDSKKVDFLDAFISKYEYDMRYSKKAPIALMKILYEYDKKHENLIDLNQLLPNGKSYLTAIPRDIDNLCETVKFFLDNEMDPNIVDSNGTYPLNLAIALNNSEFINLLIESNKIDYSKKINPLYLNVFDYVIDKLNINSIIKILNSPNFDSNKVDYMNIFNRFFLNQNSKFNYFKKIPISLLNALYEYDKNHEKLIDLNKLLPNGKSYFTAIPHPEINIVDVARFLLKNGADPNIVDSDGVCPFEYATSLNKTEFIDLLIETNKIDFSKVKQNPTQNKKQLENSEQNNDNDNQIKQNKNLIGSLIDDNSNQVENHFLSFSMKNKQQKSKWGNSMKNEQKNNFSFILNDQVNASQQQKFRLIEFNHVDSNKKQCTSWSNSVDQQPKKHVWGNSMKNEQKNLSSKFHNQVNSNQQKKSPLNEPNQVDLNQQQKSLSNEPNQANLNQLTKSWGSYVQTKQQRSIWVTGSKKKE